MINESPHRHALPPPPQGSFSWAWALDERPEERARGVTVDVAMQVCACDAAVIDAEVRCRHYRLVHCFPL